MDGFITKAKALPIGPMIVHHRKASIGGVKEELVHPLQSSDNGVLLMQNGTKRDLATIFFEASDTKALAEYWNQVSDEVLYCLLDKTGVVFAMDGTRLFFHRDSSRPLFVCTDGAMKGMYSSEPVHPGMWALVDEYVLQELPLNVAEWNLEHGTPEEYREKVCVYYNCTDKFIGRENQYRCPECQSFTSSYRPQQRTVGYGSHWNGGM